MTEPAPTDKPVSRASAGDVDADYELLGRQAAIAEWRGVLERLFELAEAGQAVDLEIVARRTIRRPVAVVSALLDLCRAVRTAQALFVTEAVGALRDEQIIEERVRTAAEDIASHLVDVIADENDPPADPLGAVYQLLSQPLTDQQELWNRASDEWRAAVTSAIRSERDRVRDLTRDTSATSGGYLHYLRHRLADLILVSGIGDDLGEWGYRILQLRTDELADLRPLLHEMPAETRQRYISWVLTPRKGAPVERIRFLLHLAGDEFLNDLDIDALRVLATHSDPAVAADALVAAVNLHPDDPTIATLASEGIAELPRDEATHVATALVRQATEHLKIAAIPPGRVDLLVKAAGDHRDELATAIADQLETMRDVEAMLPWMHALEQLPTADALFSKVARLVVERASDDPRPEPVARSLERFLPNERFRQALWTILDEVPAPVLTHLAPALLRRDRPEINARHLGEALHELTGDQFAAVRTAATDGLFEGAVEPDDLAQVWPASDRGVTATELHTIIAEAETELGRLENDLADIDAAMRRDLAAATLPIVRDAIAASAPNPGVQDTYRRLAAALAPSPAPTSGERPAEQRTGVASLLGPDHSDTERLQALLKLDTDSGDLLASADVQDQLAYGDFAQRVLRDLFERGALFQLAVRLSAETRAVVLDSALRTDFQPPAAWSEHPALGTWLRQALARRTPTEATAPDDADLAALFQVAAATFARLHALRRDAAAKRGEVSREVAARLAPLFNELNTMVDSYYQVWRGLQSAGWRPVEVIGRRIPPDQLMADRHEILSGQGSPVFIVRRPGVEVDGKVVEPAQLEGVDA